MYGPQLVENNEGTKKDKERNAGGFDTDIFFFFIPFYSLFSLEGKRLDPSSRVCNAKFQLISVGNTPRGPITFNWK